MSFTPVFDDQVYELNTLSLPPQRLNPQLYATPASAVELVNQLGSLQVSLIFQYPWPVAPGSPFSFSKQVPFIRLPSGFTANAGAYQIWWVRVPPPPDGLPLRYCIQQLQADEADWLASQNQGGS